MSVNRGDKVMVLTVIGTPVATVTNKYRDPHSQYDNLFWVRLDSGVVLKDVTWSEVELVTRSSNER